MCIGDSLQLLDSHEQLGIPNTVERVANVKIADPLRGNQNEEIDDQPLIEAVQNIICDPTEAKLPNSWKWCSVSEEYQEDDPIAYSKITAVRFGVVNQITMPWSTSPVRPWLHDVFSASSSSCQNLVSLRCCVARSIFFAFRIRGTLLVRS